MSNPSDTILAFVPSFVSETGEIARVQEGDTVVLPIAIQEVGTMTGYVGQSSVWVGNAVTLVGSVTINGQPIAFQRQLADQRVYWDPTLALTAPVPVVVRLTKPSGRFSLLNGALPPGLSLESAGIVTGIVANITVPPAEYEFTVRYQNGTHTRDRQFSVFAIGKDFPAYFNVDQLGGQETDDTYGFQYKYLTTLDRGQGYAFTFDIYDADGILPGFVVKPVTGFLADTQKYGGLPSGLVVTDQTIEGTVDEDVCPGSYYFSIHFDDSGQAGAIFNIVVTENVAPNVGMIPKVVWMTPAGNLGSIPETEPSYLGVQALAYSAPAPVYSLAPFSSPLPAGLRLNVDTGRLYGVMPYVSSDTVFSFRLRATCGQVFADRDFSITVLDWFDLESIHQLRLKMSVTEETALAAPYLSAIPQGMLYRPDDPNFGLITHPFIYVIKGLDGTKDLQPALDGEGPNLPLVGPRLNKDYNSRFKLLLGDHRYAVARDSNGTVIYEVIYREMLDPMARAGGFAITNSLPAEVPNAWAQSGVTPKYFFPTSINNIRSDLILDVGFAMTDANDRIEVGSGTHELMPLWMRSEQIAGDASTVLGFVPALVFAYLNPGSIPKLRQTINNLVNYESVVVPSNKVYHFDKYYTTETGTAYQMTFDNLNGNQTLIDSVDMIFDETDCDVIKYLD
jgi:hypothetical protein